MHGLVALMEIQASRAKASGLVYRGRADSVARSESGAMGSTTHSPWTGWARSAARLEPECAGRNAIQAAIAACHARAATAGGYGLGADRDALCRAGGDCAFAGIVELNRAVAVGMASRCSSRSGTGGSTARRTGASREYVICCPASGAICSRSWDAWRARRAREFEVAASITRNARGQVFLYWSGRGSCGEG